MSTRIKNICKSKGRKPIKTAHGYAIYFYDFRYLVLEHVSGGELFDYLVKKGRLTPKEVIGCDYPLVL